MRVVAEYVVTHQSRCLEPEVKVPGSLVTGNEFPPSWKIDAKIYMHKFACTNVTQKKKKEENGGETLTHAATHMSNRYLSLVLWA